jgi:cytidylate kinase
MIIAIDGPAGSGKSTVAKLVAGQLGFAYLDTGAMYRAVAVLAVEQNLDLSDNKALANLATSAKISFGYLPGEPLPSQVFINGQDVTAAIRTPAIDVAVSPVSATAEVRTALVEQQRIIGAAQDTVMEGRDIGTVVFPNAELKVYLTASPEARAARRTAQNAQRHGADEQLSEAEVLADIKRRDKYDSERAVAPLKPAEDSIELDTTDLSIDQVCQRIITLAKGQ